MESAGRQKHLWFSVFITGKTAGEEANHMEEEGKKKEEEEEEKEEKKKKRR